MSFTVSCRTNVLYASASGERDHCSVVASRANRICQPMLTAAPRCYEYGTERIQKEPVTSHGHLQQACGS